MNAYRMVAIVLIVAGALGLAYGGFSYTKETHQAKLGPIELSVKETQTVNIPLWAGVGVVIWLAFLAIGVEHAALWGVSAFVLDFVPYLGAMALAGGSSLVAFVQFGSLDMALLVGGVALLVHTISGNLLTPWLTSRAGRMTAVSVFVGVLAFGWLWGIWGLLLGVPILTTTKAVCDRIDDLKPIGELLDA